MKLRLKAAPHIEMDNIWRFNIHALCEVDVGDDSILCSDLEAFIVAKNEWKNFSDALRDRDIIPDNYNAWFREPKNDEERKRGWF